MKRCCLPIIGLMLAACSDPSGPPAEPDPCVSIFACRSPGMDVEVVSVSVTSEVTDPETALPIVQPAAVRVNYTIRNRGRIPAPAGVLGLNLVSADGRDLTGMVEQSRPALDPGETHSASELIPAPSLEGWGLRDDRMTVKVSAWISGDTISSNNVMMSSLFHLAIPLLELSFTAPRDVVTGQPIALSVVARNYGLHADVPAQNVTGCLYDGFRGCSPEYRTTTAGFAMPQVAAGRAVQFTTTLAIPPSGAWQDAAARYAMYLCVGQPMTYNVNGSVACGVSDGRDILVRPDYEQVCAPPALTPGVPLTIAAYNCGLRPSLAGFESETRAYRFHVVSLQAESNLTYTLQRSDTTAVVRIYDAQGNTVFDRDPAPARIRIDTAQRLYLVMYSAAESVTIAALPAADGGN